MKNTISRKKRLFPAEGRRIVTAARRQRISDLCAVILFLLLLPYVCSLFFGKNIPDESESVFAENTQEICISVPTESGRRELKLEEYLVGALAAAIPADYQEETLKAQAVILRTMCIHAWQEGRSAHVILTEDIGQNYLDEQERRDLWEDSYNENQEKMNKAVRDTEGICMMNSGKTIEPSYFRLSAGKTRDGAEVLGEDYSSLASVECTADMQASDYSRQIKISEERFWSVLGMEKQSGISLTRDSAGYVLWVELGEKRIGGEKFRSLFALDSSCFSIVSKADKVHITTYGIGHGFGFCQYDADRRAAEGADYSALLKVYFRNFELEKPVV